MSCIVVGSRDSKIRELFFRNTNQSGIQFLTHQERSPEVSTKDTLVVLDLGIFEECNEAELLSLSGQTLLLLVPVQEFDGHDLEKSGNSFQRTYFLEESNCSRQNLWFFARSLLEEIIQLNRLNSYIRDSFIDIVDSKILLQQKMEIEKLNEKLEQISRVDFLTNLLNRRALLEAFEAEKRRALRTRWRLQNMEVLSEVKKTIPDTTEFAHKVQGNIEEHMGNFACLMIDIDHFKAVNDTYGHLMGDEVLKAFGVLLHQKGIFRDSDVLGRYGGEEFLAILPETNCDHAMIPAERLRKIMSGLVFKDSEGRKFSVTLSIGISEFLPQEISCDEMIKRADEALYYSKEHGRNRVSVYEKLHNGTQS